MDGIRRLFKGDEYVQSFFWMAMFVFCVVNLKLVDLPLGQVLAALIDSSMAVDANAVSVVESWIGLCAVLMVYFSFCRLLLLLHSISFPLQHVGQ